MFGLTNVFVLFLYQLQSHLEDNPYAFTITSGTAAFITALVTWNGLRRLVAFFFITSFVRIRV